MVFLQGSDKHATRALHALKKARLTALGLEPNFFEVLAVRTDRALRRLSGDEADEVSLVAGKPAEMAYRKYAALLDINISEIRFVRHPCLGSYVARGNYKHLFAGAFSIEHHDECFTAARGAFGASEAECTVFAQLSEHPAFAKDTGGGWKAVHKAVLDFKESLPGGAVAVDAAMLVVATQGANAPSGARVLKGNSDGGKKGGKNGCKIKKAAGGAKGGRANLGGKRNCKVDGCLRPAECPGRSGSRKKCPMFKQVPDPQQKSLSELFGNNQ